MSIGASLWEMNIGGEGAPFSFLIFEESQHAETDQRRKEKDLDQRTRVENKGS